MTTRLVQTLAATTLALGLAGPAVADHENRSKPWWDRNVSREREPYAAPCERPRAGYAPHRHEYDRRVRREAYHCAPCRHRFHDYDAFTRHVHHHHHVPFWRIPFVMVEAAFGWIFYG
jgi:hypothetical protein